ATRHERIVGAAARAAEPGSTGSAAASRQPQLPVGLGQHLLMSRGERHLARTGWRFFWRQRFAPQTARARIEQNRTRHLSASASLAPSATNAPAKARRSQ